MRKVVTGIVVGILCGIIVAVGLAAYAFANNIKQTKKEAGELGKELLRFHVKANSDSSEDIKLKYKVRDAVLEGISNDLSICNSVDEATAVIDANLEKIESLAEKVVKQEGYDYPVEVYLTSDEFPIRQYGEMVIPAGEYEALRIDIGKAKGENFWCLLYPTLCYTVDTGAFVSKDGKEKLKEKLDEKKYEDLFVKHKTPKKKVKVKFKLYEAIKNIVN